MQSNRPSDWVDYASTPPRMPGHRGRHNVRYQDPHAMHPYHSGLQLDQPQILEPLEHTRETDSGQGPRERLIERTRFASPSIHHFALFAEWCRVPARVAITDLPPMDCCKERPGPSFKLTWSAETTIPGRIVGEAMVEQKQKIRIMLPCNFHGYLLSDYTLSSTK
jgi:hypothetical protein